MSEEFKRENRYLVLKMKDLDRCLSSEQKANLNSIVYAHDSSRELHGKNDLKCVVVEHDWPEYEPVWEMIEKRVEKLNADLITLRTIK